MAARKLLTLDLGTKQPYEVLDWKADFQKVLSDGRILTTITAKLIERVDDPSESPAALKIQAPEVPNPAITADGLGVVFWTAAGTAGGRYKGTLRFDTSDDILQVELDFFLAVQEA